MSMVALYRTGVNVKILEVIDQTDSILQNTDWTKTWLDWVNMVPLLQAQLPPDRVSKEQPTLQQVKAKLDAWRQANPNKFPDDAWTALGGRGPAPIPNEKIKGRDLRFQPPDDSGTWINGGTYWTHTIPPFIHAIKPDPTNKGTWGPKGADNSYISIADQISKIRPGLETAIQNDTAFQAKLTADTKGMSASDAKHYRQEMTDQLLNQQIEAKLRAIPGNGPGGKMYSNREINDGMRDEISVFNVDRMLHLHDKSEEAKEQKRQEEAEKKANKAAQKFYRKNKNKCPPGWIRNQANTACVRDPNQVPEPDEYDNCPPGWTYDEETDTCKTAETTPVVVPPKKEEEPPVVVPPKKEEEPPVVVPPKKEEEPPVTETGRMIFPVGSSKTITRGFGGGHEGIDIADQLQTIKYGTAVVAPEDGKIVYFNTEKGTPGANGYGLNIKFLSKDGQREHVFGHLSQAFPEGESFKQGEKMAEVGGIGKQYTKTDGTVVPANKDPRPGKSSGVHLHWGVKENGKFVNPLKYFK
jgi:murein DD-endopeptidase MepM/ murein hydrolase activator NlpD